MAVRCSAQTWSAGAADRYKSARRGDAANSLSPGACFPINAYEVRDGEQKLQPERSYKKATRAVKKIVVAEGGTILRSYPKIGVVIAYTEDKNVDDRLRDKKYGDRIESLGATRTSPSSLPDLAQASSAKTSSEADLQIDPEPREDEQWGNTALDSLEANEIQPGSDTVLVGVLDSGIQSDHEELAAAAGNSSYDLANKTTDTTSPNDSTPVTRNINNNCLDMPAELPGVVTVTATTEPGPKASFSNYGDGVIDVAGPGSSILSTTWPDSYGSLSGTSMASPHVAGVAALILSEFPDLTPAQVRQRLNETAVDVPCPGDGQCTGTPEYNGYFGNGLVNALNVVTD